MIAMNVWLSFILVTIAIFSPRIIRKIKEYYRNRIEIKNSDSEDRDDEKELNIQYEYDGLTPALEERSRTPYLGAKVSIPGGIDSFYRMVNDRRSVRSYSKKKINFSIIEKCILAAGTGPSGAHTEPWTFCVIEDDKLKHEIRQIVESEELENYTHRMSRQWTTDLRPLKTNHIKEYLTDAPYLILIFKQVYGFRADGQRQQHYYNELSVAISTGILLCALQSAGLNSLITTPLNCGTALRTLLNRPMNEKLLFLLPVGYPSSDCTVPDLQRKNINDILIRH